MNTIDYPPAITELLAIPCRMPLGPGVPLDSMAATLRGLALPRGRDDRMGRACLAGLWLRFNFLDESHRISQDINTTTGSFWHAIMHRREPDPSNSKYWWRRVGSHPVLEQLQEQSLALGYDYRSPYDFVDHCERVRGSGSAEEQLAERIQALEWRLLFDYCLREAIG